MKTRIMTLLCAALLTVTTCTMTACLGFGEIIPADTDGKSAADQVAEHQGQNNPDPWAGNGKDPAPADTEKEEPTTQPPAPVTEPVTQPAVKPVDPPKEDPKPAETEAPEPEETEPAETEPAELPGEPVIPGDLPSSVISLPAAGKLTSQQSKNLVLGADYTAAQNTDGTLTVNVGVSLSSYEIFASARENSGMLTVNGENVLFSTPQLTNEERSIHTFPLLTKTFTLPAGTTQISIQVQWQFGGNYGGTYITDLTAGAVLVVG